LKISGLRSERTIYAACFLLFALSVYKVATFKPGPIKDDPGLPHSVTWNTLAQLDYRKGVASAKLERYNGIHVRVPGFMVPVGDSVQNTDEFLLTPVSMGCIHVPPPPPNSVIHVKMKDRVAYSWKPIWVSGKLSIEKEKAPEGLASFKMSGISVAPYEGSGFPVQD